MMGSSQIVKILLRQKLFSINSLDNNGFTPAHFAVATKSTKSLKLIMSCPDFQLNIKNNRGWTPVQLAAIEGFFSMIVMMSKHDQFSYYHDLPQGTRSPLSYALQYANMNIVKYLYNIGMRD